MIVKAKITLDPELKAQLQKYVYDIVGVIQDVYKELPIGMPEYIYQEALGVAFSEAGIPAWKEHRHHPVYKGHSLSSFLKMDYVVPNKRGNVIIECKALENLTSKEYQQLFSYMLGTQYPIGIIVNFHSYPHATIYKFYYDKTDLTITAF